MASLQICYHGHCFDGMLSAAVFLRFYRQKINAKVDVTLTSMAHSLTDPFGDDHEKTFFADDNAVVDFRYSASPRLTWWCDHHQSAFMSDADRENFATHPSPQKHLDISAPSCTGLLARWLGQQHGFDATPVADLVYWADIIDTARFISPAQIVELREPALQLMSILETQPDTDFVASLIEDFNSKTIPEVHSRPDIGTKIKPILDHQQSTIEMLKNRREFKNGVALFDLTHDGVMPFSKFVPYYLDPNIRYTIGITHEPKRAKVSVGSNPWHRPNPLTNLGDLCAKYGGGGHPVVGAVSLPVDQLDEARRIGREIFETLSK